jgi:ribosomal protein L23
MRITSLGKPLHTAAVLCCMGVLATPAVPSITKLAVVVSAGSKLQDIPLTDLAKLCKGTQKAWPDGKNFTLVMKDPESPEMKVAIQKLFGLAPNEVKAMIAKLNELREVVKIVDSEADLLRVDGKLPFDLGYALKGT